MRTPLVASLSLMFVVSLGVGTCPAQGQAPSAAGRGTPEATSLLGKPLYRIELAPDAKKAAEESLEKARQAVASTPGDANALIWLGRRAAVAGHVREAIDAFTTG